MKLYIDVVSACINVSMRPLEHTSFAMRGLISKYNLKVLISISVVIMHQILTGKQVNNCKLNFVSSRFSSCLMLGWGVPCQQ